MQRSRTWTLTTIVIAIIIGLVSLPVSSRTWMPDWLGLLKNADWQYGLDLAGGTQLDFRISETEIVEEKARLQNAIEAAKANGASQEDLISLQNELFSLEEQATNVVEAIRTVLERRLNSLGVKEAQITPSYYGAEKHLLVDCPGELDVQNCIDTVGKTIRLEFKTRFDGDPEQFNDEIQAKVDASLARINDESITLAVIGQESEQESEVYYFPANWQFEDTMPNGLEDLWNQTTDQGIVQRRGSLTTQRGDGSIGAVQGIFLSEVLENKTSTGRTLNGLSRTFDVVAAQAGLAAERFEDQVVASDEVLSGTLLGIPPRDAGVRVRAEGGADIIYLENFTDSTESMSASHILVSYTGALRADETVTRTKEEALAKANDLKAQLDGGASFNDLATNESDGPSASEQGSLGEFSQGGMVAPFEEAAFALGEGEISDVIETDFGYHIIRADTALTTTSPLATYNQVRVTGSGAEARAEELLTQMREGVTIDEQAINVHSVFYSLEPSWVDTELDGRYFRSAAPTLDHLGSPVVQIQFDSEGGRLFQELTRNNIGQQIAIFVGGTLVSAPNVSSEIAGGSAIISGVGNFDNARILAQDLNTGAIPAPIYLAGQRTVEPTLGADALAKSTRAALLGLLLLMIYMIIMYRGYGVMAAIALALYAIVLSSLLKLPIVGSNIILTLAGMAGIILSIGMAVDANVLIFERIKEERKNGKVLSTAAETGFKRAWPSIRDGNVSTFITCIILFTIGTSIVRGFALMLALGVALSMFSAIIITRFLLRKAGKTTWGESKSWFF